MNKMHFHTHRKNLFSAAACPSFPRKKQVEEITLLERMEVIPRIYVSGGQHRAALSAGNMLIENDDAAEYGALQEDQGRNRKEYA